MRTPLSVEVSDLQIAAIVDHANQWSDFDVELDHLGTWSCGCEQQALPRMPMAAEAATEVGADSIYMLEPVFARRPRAATFGTALLLLGLLACCGGGDPEDEHVPTPGVDCTAKPETCK